MASDLRVRLSDDAAQDFDTILDYTIQQYGEDHEAAYRIRVEKALASLGRHPESGKERPEYGPGIRSRIVGEHQIIYRVMPREVLVYEIRYQGRDRPKPR